MGDAVGVNALAVVIEPIGLRTIFGSEVVVDAIHLVGEFPFVGRIIDRNLSAPLAARWNVKGLPKDLAAVYRIRPEDLAELVIVARRMLSSLQTQSVVGAPEVPFLAAAE